MMRFFMYFGHKQSTVSLYPRPTYGTIIEPFAGSAGYATRYHDRDIRLIERDEKIYAIWHYLINVKSAEVRALPLVEHDTDVGTLSIPQAARWLIGLWINPGSASPKRHMTAWGKQQRSLIWSAYTRDRIAAQVDRISHWQIHHGDYSGAPDIKATWFIDPPYQLQGKQYAYGSDLLNYTHVGNWIRARQGQTIVCENMGANWLPFRFLARTATLKRGKGKINLEAIYTQNT